MSGELRLYPIGNLTDDPDLRYTPGGVAICKFRIATNPRYRDSQGQWKDGEPGFVSCVAWKQLAENVTESFKKGSRVIAAGEWKMRSYETQQGEKRSSWELHIDAIGPDLRYGTAKFAEMARSSAGAAPTGGSDEDPWATNEPGY